MLLGKVPLSRLSLKALQGHNAAHFSADAKGRLLRALAAYAQDSHRSQVA